MMMVTDRRTRESGFIGAVEGNNFPVAQLIVQFESNFRIAEISFPKILANHPRMIEMFAKAGGDLNIPTFLHGLTLLHISAEWGFEGLEVTKTLVRNGADFRIHAKAGYFPIHMAKDWKTKEFLGLLHIRLSFVKNALRICRLFACSSNHNYISQVLLNLILSSLNSNSLNASKFDELFKFGLDRKTISSNFSKKEMNAKYVIWDV